MPKLQNYKTWKYQLISKYRGSCVRITHPVVPCIVYKPLQVLYERRHVLYTQNIRQNLHLISNLYLTLS